MATPPTPPTPPDWRAHLRRRLHDENLEATREAEIIEELAQHLEQRHAELLALGHSPDSATATALDEIDSPADPLARRLRATTPRATHAPPLGAPPRGSRLADLAADARFAIRSLLKRPGFAAVTLLSLALGIGANSAIFQLLDSLHLQLLPLDRPGELGLIRIENTRWRAGRASGSHPDVSTAIYDSVRRHQQTFTDVLAWGDGLVNLEPHGVARWARAMFLTGNAFEILGVHALHGRTFTAADDRRGCDDPGVVVSHGFWQRELGGDPGAVGRKLTLERHTVTVIGVTPPSFFGLEVGRSFDVAVPLCLERTLYGELSITDLPHGFWLSIVGRLRPGETLEHASAQLAAASPAIFEQTLPPGYDATSAARYRAFRLGATPAAGGISQVRERYSRPLAFLFGIAALLLLIACANLANLFLARASARERELSIRLAIGASRGRLIRQLMAESLLIALVGAALGLVVARFLDEYLLTLLSTPSETLFLQLTPSWRVLAFTAGVASLTCLLFGLVPAVRASRADVGAVLKATAPSTTESRFGLRRALVSVQVALSFVLLFGALLFARSLHNLTTLDPGFRTDLVAVTVDASALAMPSERRVPFVDELVARARATPGVEAAAATLIVPLSGNGWNDRVTLDPADREHPHTVMFHRVTPGYFDTLGAPLLAGRDFGPGDTRAAPRVAIVTARFAQQIFPAEPSVIGRRFHVVGSPGVPDQSYEIIGVVADMKYRTLRETTEPTAFLPLAQSEEPDAYTFLVVRSALPPSGIVGALQRNITDLDPRVVIEVDLLSQLVARSVLVERLMATLAAFFGLLAALLAVVGLYGVVSYGVARRVHEIGIRMALGADARRVARMIVGEAALLLGVGLAAGVALSLVVARAVGALLYGLAPHDPLTLALAVAAMTVVTLLAALVPARRAARTDPMVALRDE